MSTTLVYPSSHQSCFGHDASSLYTPSKSYTLGPTTALTVGQHPAANTGNSSSPSSTALGASPTSGNLLIACVAVGSNVLSTAGPSGWSLLGRGPGASRNIEWWWKRSDGTETGSFTWTLASGGLWSVFLAEFGGGPAVGDPTYLSATNNTAGATSVSVTGSTSLDADGATAIVTAIILSSTSGGWNTDGNPSSSIQQAPTTLDSATSTSDRRWSYCEPWKNRDTASDVAGTTYSWTTSHAYSVSCIRLNGIGRNAGTDTADSTIAWAGVNGDTGVAAPCYGQAVFDFDTSGLADTTPTSATLTLTTRATLPSNAGNATLEARKVASAFSALANDDAFPFYSPSALGTATLLASKAISSFTTPSTAVDLTSDAGFPAAVETTGHTYIVIATNDQRDSTTRTTSEIVKFHTEATSGTTSDPVLTIVQPSQDLAPSSIDSAEAFGTATVTVGAVNIAPDSITSGESVGTPTVTPGAVTIAPTSIGTGESVGVPTISTPAEVAASAGRARATAVRVVHPDGTLVADITECVHVDGWTEELNHHGDWQITADPYCLSVTDLALDSDHEVQIFYDGTLRQWGPVRWAEIQAGPKVVFHGFGASEWFEHRHFGEAKDNSFGANMSFELDASITAGDTPWAINGFYVSPLTITADRDTTHVLKGTYAIKLDIPAVTGGWQFITQAATTPDIPTVNAKAWFTAWYYTTAADYAALTADRSFPLAHFLALDVSGDVIGSSDVFVSKENLIDGQWTRVECELFIPDTTHSIEFRLHGLDGGTIWWDYARITTDPFLDETETSAAQVLADLCNYGQGRTGLVPITQDWPTTIKTDLNIDPGLVGSGATIISRTYHTYARANVWAEMDAILQAGLGVDMQMVYDHEAGTRTMRLVSPALGSTKPGLELKVGHNVSADFTGVIDGRKNASAFVTLSDATGPAAEFGFANDTTGFDATLLEEVEPAASDIEVNMLDAEATAGLARSLEPKFLPDLIAPASIVLDDGLALGDTVPLRIDEGWIQEDLNVRIVRIAWDPDSDTVRLTPNPTSIQGRNVPPSLARIVGDLRRRLYQIERSRPTQPRTPPPVREVITFTFDPASTGDSAPDDSVYGGRISRVSVNARTAPSGGDATFLVKLDGSTVATLTLPDGDTEAELVSVNSFVQPLKTKIIVDPTALNGADGINVMVEISSYLGRL